MNLQCYCTFRCSARDLQCLIWILIWLAVLIWILARLGVKMRLCMQQQVFPTGSHTWMWVRCVRIIYYCTDLLFLLQTLTSHSCIFGVTTKTADSRASGAVNEVVLTTSAANTIQVDCPSASTKVGITKSHCICWNECICKCRTDL